MKMMRIQLGLIMLVLALSSCYNNPKKTTNKYKNYITQQNLESIKRIQHFSFRGWSSLDSQYFILSASQNKSYLIELYNHCNDLDFSASIRLNQSMDNILSSNFDSISIPNQHFQDKCRIDNIFLLSQQQVKELNALK
jgi:hypothetical protein